ncbi:hypothetical protein Sgou_51930 [Streptomyces gougerotii]|uniref:Uncharacterized protein n=1 Tax=Streptomyces gougerotii TaxID=53448 RepID=A0ABQ1DDE1_9ACTN|nr:hypothetical protein Sgou_51930 [Streptomyces gougerotii]
MEAERPSTSPDGALSLVKNFTNFPERASATPPGRPSQSARDLPGEAQTDSAEPGLKGRAPGRPRRCAPRPGRSAQGGGPARRTPRGAADGGSPRVDAVRRPARAGEVEAVDGGS